MRSRILLRGPRTFRRLAALVLAAAAVGVVSGGGAGAAPSCDKFASPLGLNTNPGTELLPYRTAQRLANSLLPGQTGCLEPGTYAGGMTIARAGTAASPVTIRSRPGGRATIVGRVRVEPGADHVTLADLALVGTNPENAPSPLIEADHVIVQDSDITNLHTADCVFIGSPDATVTDTTIRRNRIHNCGLLPANNRHQAVTVWSAVGTKITANVIYDNANRGIQLFPNAQGTYVAYNTLDANGDGVLILGGGDQASSNNVVERNVITNSTQRDNLATLWPGSGPVGTGNVFRDNCVWGGAYDNGDGGVKPRMEGVTLSGNLVAEPAYADRARKNFGLSPSSPCISVISGLVWRPFRDDSLWNVPAAQKGTPTPDNPFASRFVSYSNELEIAGIPGSGTGGTYAKPIYFAQPGDPVASVSVAEPSWVKGDIRWDGRPIPVPAGVTPAPGSDGHLVVVSADRRTAWEMWRCTKADATGYETVTISQWDLTGSGVAGVSIDNSSARGSGTPVIPTTIRAEEALHGIRHALGITVPRVSNDYIYPPATHSDGELGPEDIKYGMLFVLRADYPIPANASIGERNVIQALKTYGAYVVDQGASMELDADSTHPELWQQSGLNSNSLDIGPQDFRLIR